MLTLGIEMLIVVLAIVGAVCAAAGYAYAQKQQRRAGGGKTAEELKAELADYQENVTEHFQHTANLLHGMTEQYRTIYEHMAAGAQEFCDAERATSQIESLRTGLLSAPDTPPTRAKESSGPPDEHQAATDLPAVGPIDEGSAADAEHRPPAA